MSLQHHQGEVLSSQRACCHSLQSALERWARVRAVAMLLSMKLAARLGLQATGDGNRPGVASTGSTHRVDALTDSIQ